MFKKEMSISFHIGSKKNAIPNLKKLKAIFVHNLRKYQKSNNPDLDLSKSQYNIILKGTKNLVEDVKKLYKTEFDEAVYNYNQKQTREDRKILNYLSKIEEDKQKNIATEIILQIGDKEDWQNASLEDKKKMAEVFKNSLEILEAKGFKVANATLHLDETSPHLHVVGVPIGTDFKKGLEKQVSSKSVFSIGKLEILREKIEKTIIEDFNKVYNVNIEKKQEKGLIEEHLSITDYKQIKPVLDELVKMVDKNTALEQIKEENKKKDKQKLEKEEELKTKTKEVAEAEEKAKEIVEKKKTLETDLINNKNKLDNIQKEKEQKDYEIELEFKNLFAKKQEIEKKKKELEQKEKELEELEAKEKELENKKKELEEIRQNKENIDFLIAQELEKKKQIEKKKQEIERLNNNYKEMEAKLEDEKERIKESIEIEKENIKKFSDEVIEKKRDEEARLKEKEEELEKVKTVVVTKEKELQELRENKENVVMELQKKEKEVEEIKKKIIEVEKENTIENSKLLELIEKEKSYNINGFKIFSYEKAFVEEALEKGVEKVYIITDTNDFNLYYLNKHGEQVEMDSQIFYDGADKYYNAVLSISDNTRFSYNFKTGETLLETKKEDIEFKKTGIFNLIKTLNSSDIEEVMKHSYNVAMGLETDEEEKELEKTYKDNSTKTKEIVDEKEEDKDYFEY